MKPGTLVIDCSTIDVDSARKAHALAAEQRRCLSLDAPVSGGVGGAKAATLTFMAGGAPEAFARAEPILAQMGKRVVHCGEAGAGQAAKICNNMILGISMIGVAEAFVLAEKLGLSHQALFDVASTSSGQCWSLTTYCPVPGPGADLAGQQRLQAGLRGRPDAEGPEARAGGRARVRRHHAARRGGGAALCPVQRRRPRRATTSPASSTSCAGRPRPDGSPSERSGGVLHGRRACAGAKAWGVLHSTYSFPAFRRLVSGLRTFNLGLPFPMARSTPVPADPSADAAAILRRVGFAILFFAIPLSALFARRAVVVLAPVAVILLVLAAVLDGAPSIRSRSFGTSSARRAGWPARSCCSGRPCRWSGRLSCRGLGAPPQHRRHGPHGACRLSGASRPDARRPTSTSCRSASALRR